MEYYKAMASIIENATDASKSSPNVNDFREVAELIKTRSDMPKEAVKNFMARFSKKTKQVVLLTIELIEYCTYACELNFHTALNNKEFLLRISALLSGQSTEQIVKDRVLQLLSVLNAEFKKDIHTLYFQFSERVSSKGFNIPYDYVSKYRGSSVGSNYKPSSSIPKSSGFGSNNGFSGNSYKPSGGSNKPYVSKSKDPGSVAPKFQAAKRDLMKLKEKIQEANQMIDDHNPNQSVRNNVQLTRLMEKLGSMDTELQNLIGQVIEDEAMTAFALPLNDDLNATLERYDLLKKGVKLENKANDEVEPEILRQIAELELREKQQKQQQNTGFGGFGGEDTFDQFEAPKTQQTFNKPTPVTQQPPQNDNLLDLMDDDVPPPQNTLPQQNNQQNNNNTGGDLFDIMDAPVPVNNSANNSQNQPQQQKPAVNIDQLYQQNNQQNQQQQQQQQQNKYAAFDQPQQPQMNTNPYMNNNPNMGMNQGGMGMNQGGMGMNQGGMGMNQGGMGMNMGMNQGGMGMSTNQNQNMGMGMNNGGMNMGMNNQGSMGMGMNNNYNNTQQQPKFQPPTNNQQTFLPQGYQPSSSNTYQNQNKPKAAFDDLDDMFGVKTNKNNNQPQQQQNQPPQNQYQPQQQQYQQPPQQQQQSQSDPFDLL